MRNHIKVLLSLSLIAAVSELAFMVYLNEMFPIRMDYLLLLLYLYLPNVLLSIPVLLVLSLFCRSLKVSPSEPSEYLRAQGLVVSVLSAIFALDIELDLFRMYYFEYRPGSRGIIYVIFGVIFLTVTLLCLLSFLYREFLKEAFRRLKLTIARFSLAFTVAVFLAFSYHSLVWEAENQPPDTGGSPTLHNQRDLGESRPRILLLGLDGLSFDSLDRLSSEGRIPNLKSIMESGSQGYLRSAIPTLSPMLWTSISTGKVESKHGIHDFRMVKLPGIRPFRMDLVRVKFASILKHYISRSSIVSGRLYTYQHYISTMRRCKNLWNILAENGLEVGVVGWYASWPAEDVNGFIISDRSFLYSKSSDDFDAGLTHPDSIFANILEYLISPSDVSEESLLWLCDPPEGSSNRWRDGCREVLSIYFEAIQKNYIKDLGTLGVSLYMLENYPSWDVMMIYFRSVDSMNHVVFHQIHEKGDSMGDSLYLIPDNYYEFVDEIIGRLRERVDDETILMIVSDHGWDHNTGHPYAPDGVFLMSGGFVTQGCHMEGVSIYDIAPTVLYLRGLPIARDMDGSPVLSCLDPAFTANHPVKYIPTYEEEVRPRLETHKSLIDNEIDKQLKALGYIE